MSKVIMIQGTMSNAGKSLIAGGLCRVFRQDGYRVAPFKSQNMALNSFVTEDGLEMGRAQVMQAECAGIRPSVYMNPVLLKPTNDMGSQVIVNGEVVGNMPAREYYAWKKNLIPSVLDAFRKLEEQADIIVIEGAGSPAEINLQKDDFVNMGLAGMLDAPVLLVGDIDRGGVFAQLVGTVVLLEPEERARIQGLIINKFRGDVTLLDPGIDMLEERLGIPVIGTVPYKALQIDDEDSLSERLEGRRERGAVNIAAIRFPRISNFTDLAPFESIPGVGMRYITEPKQLEEWNPDLLILPGSKNTIRDLKWLRETGLEAAIQEFSERHPVIGICGGYQMLGEWVYDPDGVEDGGSVQGLGLLPVDTILRNQKRRAQVRGTFGACGGVLRDLSGRSYSGYEIHMGETSCETSRAADRYPPIRKKSAGISASADLAGTNPADVNSELLRNLTEENAETDAEDMPAEPSADFRAGSGTGAGEAKVFTRTNSGVNGIYCGNVYGTYVHGIFDQGDLADRICRAMAEAKGAALPEREDADYSAFREKEYDRLADLIRGNLDMEAIYGMLREAAI